MTVKRIFLTFLLSLNCFFSFGLTVNEVLTKMRANYSEAPLLEYYMEYELYKGYKSTTPESIYQGFCYKSGSNLYQKIADTELIYTTDFCLKINSEEKAMILSDGRKDVPLSDIDLDLVLKECKSKELEEFDTYFKITLKLNDQSLIPVTSMSLKIDKKFRLTRMDIFYSDNLDFSEVYSKVELDFPHLRIHFKEISTKPGKKEYLFDSKAYIMKSNKSYVPTGKYANYEFLNYMTISQKK